MARIEKRFQRLCAGLVAGLTFAALAQASEHVTVDNFDRALTDVTLKGYVAKGALGAFIHERQPASVKDQSVVRLNRDTLYSFAVIDLSQPATIVKPDPDGRYQSMMVLDQDQYVVSIEYGAGTFALTRDQVGTRYACVIIRTFVDASDPRDIEAANGLQDKVTVTQDSTGAFEMPDWDMASLGKVRGAIDVLAATRSSARGMFGQRGEVTPLSHLLGTAYGWGGLPENAAVYDNFVPSENDGTTPYQLTVRDVPVRGFWSVTVYGKDGFMVENDQNAYSYNNVTAQKSADGSITIHFGSGEDAANNLPITPGWNYVVRMYEPEQDIIDGSWKFPAAVPVK